MKMQDYIEFMLDAENAPAMQLRALEHYGKFTSSQIGAVGEIIRERLNLSAKLKAQFTVRANDLVNLDATVLFPNSETRDRGPIRIRISEDPHQPILYQISAKRYAYRFKLNYKVHVDPVTTMLDMLPVYSS